MAPLLIFPGYVWLLMAGAFGSLWGSFANVVIVRWPQGLSIAWPGSHCFSCGTPINAWDNVPILSFLWLRGRCRTCGGAIALRYPMVELALALLSAACFRDTVLLADSLEAVTLINYALSFAFCWALVVIAFIDLATQLIPTKLTAAMTVIGLAARLLLPGGGGDALDGAIGVAVGFGVVFSLGQGYRLLRGEVGMGLGDAHLMAMVGAVIGWRGALFTLVAGAVQGALVQLVMYLADRKWREGPVSSWRRPVPFGPFLAIGALEVVVFGASLEPLVLRLLTIR
jgi:leader peptidase (prepilin peptidase) / N-methyltransferase